MTANAVVLLLWCNRLRRCQQACPICLQWCLCSPQQPGPHRRPLTCKQCYQMLTLYASLLCCRPTRWCPTIVTLPCCQRSALRSPGFPKLLQAMSSKGCIREVGHHGVRSASEVLGVDVGADTDPAAVMAALKRSDVNIADVICNVDVCVWRAFKPGICPRLYWIYQTPEGRSSTTMMYHTLEHRTCADQLPGMSDAGVPPSHQSWMSASFGLPGERVIATVSICQSCRSRS